MFSFAKQYQKISILPSQKGLEFPEGWGKGLRETPFCGGGMDIFWSYTLSSHMAH